MPFGLGVPELIILLVIVIMVFGAGRVAGLGKALGKAIRDFRAEATDGTQSDRTKVEG